ncbi:unnamed protein product, partial [Linum perenne]
RQPLPLSLFSQPSHLFPSTSSSQSQKQTKILKISETHPRSYVVAGVDPLVAVVEPSEPSRKKGVTPPPLSFRLLSITWPPSPYFVSRRRHCCRVVPPPSLVQVCVAVVEEAYCWR